MCTQEHLKFILIICLLPFVWVSFSTYLFNTVPSTTPTATTSLLKKPSPIVEGPHNL